VLNLGGNGKQLDKPGEKEKRANMAHMSEREKQDLPLVSTCMRKTEQTRKKTVTKQKKNWTKANN
jgi:hypothetical protein